MDLEQQIEYCGGEKGFATAIAPLIEIMNHQREAVQVGVKWLDKEKPNWHQLINIDALQITSCEQCICGQLFMEDMLVALSCKETLSETGFDFASEFMPDCAESMGFDTKYQPDVVFGAWMYENLTFEWVNVIEKRLAND